MSGVDDKVVSIEFDNARFESRLNETIKSLDQLEKTLRLTGAINGLTEVSAAANRFDTSRMASAVENISNKFSALGVVGFTVIQKLTESVIGFAHSGIDKILDPILSGGRSRAINLENAKFAFEGLGINVEKAMASAKEAVLGTAFGLDEAAKAAAVFGGAGISAGKDMTQALRGIAGVAALTNTSFSEIADIFTASAASGVVNNQDLQQFATRGLDAAATLAKALHVSEAQVHELARDGKISFAQFSKAMDDAFGKHAQDANKTFTGALANMHAAMSRIGASFFTPFLVNQRDIFNAITPALDRFGKSLDPVVKSFTKINTAGAKNLIKFINGINFKPIDESMKILAVAFENIMLVIHQFTGVISAAFKNIFPPSTVSLIVTLSRAFLELTEKFIMGGKTLGIVGDIFTAFFGTIKTVWTIVKELFAVVKSFSGVFSGAGGGVLELVDKLAALIIKLNFFLVEGGGIHRFFIRLREVAEKAAHIIEDVKVRIATFIGLLDFDPSKSNISKGLDAFGDGFGRLGQRADQASKLWQGLKSSLHGVGDILNQTFDVISKWFKELGHKLADAFKPGDFDATVDVVNAGLLGGIFLALKKFLDGDLFTKLAPHLMDKIGGMFDQLTGTLKSMQQQIKADTLFKIAEAIGIITISLVALSLIDSKKLTQALIALTVGFGELIGTMAAMDKVVGSNVSAIKLGIIGAALIEFATAALILVGAIAILSLLNWDQLSRGLTGIAIGLGLLVASAKILNDGIFGSAGAALAGAAMIAMATALNLLAGAVSLFARLSLGDLAKGMGAVAIGLGLMVAALKILDTGVLGGAGAALAGAGMILIATALNILAGAVKLFATMSVGELAKGLIAIAAGLVIIAGAMKLMPITLPITAAGLLVLSIALNILAGAVALMGHQNLDTLAKGIGAFAVMLGVLAIGMDLMTGALPGAAALLVVAFAMKILASVLEKISGIDTGSILKALATMAAVIALFAGLSVLLSEAIAPMLGLGIALIAIGAGFALLGAGLFLLGKGLEAIAKSGVAGAEALVKVMGILGKALIAEIVNELKDLLKIVPLLVRLIEAIILQLLETIIKLAPKLGQALIVLFIEGLKVLRTIFPQLIQTGIDLLLALLNGIANNIDKVITAAVNIIANLAQGLVDNIPILVDAVGRIIEAILLGISNYALAFVDAGVNMLINFLLGITQEVQRIIDTVTFIIITIIDKLAADTILIANAGTNALVAFLGALTGDIAKIIDAVANLITSIINQIGARSVDITNAGADALIHFLNGLGQKIPQIISTVSNIIGNIMDEIGVQVPRFVQRGFDMMVALLDGIANAIRANSKRMGESMANLAEAMVEGFGTALKAAIRKFVDDEFPSAISGVINKALDVLDISSPSKVFMHIGNMVATGFGQGITDNFNKPINAVEAGGNTMIESMQNTVDKLSTSLGDLGEFNPTITPVLDLTKVQLEATKIDGLMKVSAITPTVSTDNANLISTQENARTTTTKTPDQTIPQGLKFEQNIYAPTELSTNDIYRKTKSQIALAKEELNIS